MTDSVTSELEQNNPAVVINKAIAVDNGVRIISSNGVFHVSLRMDFFMNFSRALVPFVIWLNSLDESHKIVLSVLTPRVVQAVPNEYLTLFNALDRCAAHISIKMDHYEPSFASYMYLVADTVIAYPAGAIFFGPVLVTRVHDNQQAQPAWISYIQDLARRSKERGFLSDRELDAILECKAIGLMYKDLVSRDLTTVGTGLELRE